MGGSSPGRLGYVFVVVLGLAGGAWGGASDGGRVISDVEWVSRNSGVKVVDRTGGARSAGRSKSNYAVQVYAGPSTERLPRVDRDSLPEGAESYTVPFLREGESWVRLRVGFFGSVPDARAVRDALAVRFPDAWVTPVSGTERTIAGKPRSEDEPRVAVRNPEPRPAKGVARSSTPSVVVPTDPRVVEWMEAGREHLRAGRPKQAIPLFTKVSSVPGDSLAPEAKELLAVSRERNGQIAHAKAEYEEYLELYPEHEGAGRVRQRYATLISAAKPARSPLPARPRPGRSRYELSGTVATYYLLDRRKVSGSRPRTTHSALDNDIFLNGRGRVDGFDLRTSLAGSFRADFLRGGSEQGRLQTAFLEVGERGGRWEAMVGRRAPAGGGIVQRYDGLGVRYGIPAGLGLAVTAGFPVEFGEPLRLQTDKFFAGFAVDLELARSWFVEIFGVYYAAEGFVDRVGIGGEVRYFQDGVSLSGLVDFDVYHRFLNVAFVSASWQLSESTHVQGMVDHRASPLLRTENALIGESLSHLKQLLLSRKEIERLARDRTARSTFASVGINHRVDSDLFLSGDIGVSHFGEADFGGDASEPLSFGPEVFVTAQVLANGLWMDGSISALSLRYRRGDTSSQLAFLFDGRSPSFAGFRLGPQIMLDYRSVNGSKTVGVEPAIRVEYNYRQFRADARLQYRWRSELDSSQLGDEQGLSFSLGFWLNF